MNDTIALDFGTMRTKVAYHDTTRNSLELMRLGRDERPYIPSLFFLGEDGRRLFGDDAVEHLDSDPLAFLPKPLKRELREQWVRAGNRVKATPTELLSILFCGLRNRTSEVACFRETAPTGIFLTVPAQYGPPDREVLAKAAHNAGFYEERIRFVDEPVAAAQAWLAELGGTEDFVVVLDCGGGTLDWACLHRSEGGRFELLPELPPGGDNRVGGFDVDEAIYALVDDAITDTSIRNELETRRCLIRDQVRALKERHSRTGDGGRVRVGNVPVEIPGEVIADIVASRFITQACQNLCSYLDKVRERVKIETPTVLLVGGSARLRGFKEAVTEQCRCKTVWWERSEYATVLGAMIPTKGGQKKSTANAAKSIPKPVQPKPEPTDGGAPPPRPKASATSITTPAPSKEDAASALLRVKRPNLQQASIMIGSEIPADRIVNAWQAYAQMIPVSDVVLLHDATLWGTGKKGLLASATEVCVSSSSDNKTWHAAWKDVRWLSFLPAMIAFDDVTYTLANANSPLLFEALDAIHAIHRTSDFFARSDVQTDLCKSLLMAQFLPITELFESAFFGPIVVVEGQCPDFGMAATSLLQSAVESWIAKDKVEAFLACTAEMRGKVRQDMEQISKQYDALLKDWNRIKSACEAQKDPNAGLKKGAAVVGGILASILLANPAPAAAASAYAWSGNGNNAQEPIKEAWKKLCSKLAGCAKNWLSLVDQQVACVEKHFGGIERLLEDVDMPRLYTRLTTPLATAPLVSQSSRIELFSKMTDEFCYTDDIQVADFKGTMAILLAGFGRKQ